MELSTHLDYEPKFDNKFMKLENALTKMNLSVSKHGESRNEVSMKSFITMQKTLKKLHPKYK